MPAHRAASRPAARRKRPPPLFAVRAPAEPCGQPECDGPALQHAPAGGDGRPLALCAEHLAAYNRACMERVEKTGNWEAQLRSDAVWNRPTWPAAERIARGVGLDARLAGAAAAFRAGGASGSHTDAADSASTARSTSARPQGQGMEAMRLPPPARAALRVLGLAPSAGRAEIRRRYAELVKRLHPDLRAPAPARARDDERLRAVNRAWQDLKPFLARRS